MVKFYDDEDTLIYGEPQTNSQIIRTLAVIPGRDPSHEIIGWDTNGDGEADVIPATATEGITATAIVKCNHRTVIDAAVPVTCTETGFTEGSHYEACGKVFVKQTSVNALGHDFADEWTVDIEPTETSTGLKSRPCSRCDETTDPIEFVEIVDSSKLFKDIVIKDWSKAGIDYVVSYGYMNGTSTIRSVRKVQ